MNDRLNVMGRRIARLLVVLLATLFGTGLAAFGIANWWSPGTPPPVLDGTGQNVPGALSEKSFVEINGVAQGMFIQSRDTSNPVLLFIHGGPGMPELFLNEHYPSQLEQVFTVCWWEQRGAGLSFDPDAAESTLTARQIVSDAVEVSRHLLARFGRDKIYLMGHSNGSFLGIQAAARAPELYHAYIGVAQVTDQIASEGLAYRFMVDTFQHEGDASMVARLEAAPPGDTVPLPDSYLSIRDEAMHALGIGTTRDMRSVVHGIFFATWRSPAYTLGEKVGLWRGKWSAASTRLWNEMLSTPVPAIVPRLEIPAYFFHGRHDYTVSYSLAHAFADSLSAPLKGFYTFERSAHSPTFEEPEHSIAILRHDVLQRTNGMSDRLSHVRRP